MKHFFREYGFPLALFLVTVIAFLPECRPGRDNQPDTGLAGTENEAGQAPDTMWHGRNKQLIPGARDTGNLIWYGEQLIERTSYYLGPRGTVAQITNGLNCQNCHLGAGTLPYGNNFGKVYSTYPQYRARSNKIQTIYDRINGCLERSMNGKTLDTNAREMKAIYAYMRWLGEGVPKGKAGSGTGMMKLPYLDRAADPVRGKAVFVANCQTCHGADGQGQLNGEGTGYTYPPLWGPHSYNDGAGMTRLGSFASFVKNNMPFGTTYHAPRLTDEQAWDVAAYVDSQPRPHKDQRADWADPEKKPIDYPFGPYTDSFSEKQHKYGPFKPIKAAHDVKRHL